MKAIGIAAAVVALVTVSMASAAEIVTATDGNTKVTILNPRDFMIEAATQPAAVDLHFANADRIDFGTAGELQIIKANGTLVHYHPDAYQVINGKVKPVSLIYKMNGKDRVTMKLGKFDKDVPVILHRGAATL